MLTTEAMIVDAPDEKGVSGMGMENNGARTLLSALPLAAFQSFSGGLARQPQGLGNPPEPSFDAGPSD